MKGGISRAMVFAAGRGQRLRPLSDFLPKPAMPLPDGPLISSALRLAGRLSKRIVVNSWWLAGKLETATRKAAPPGVDLEISREDQQMETAGGLALARDRGLLGFEGPILVINGDGILNLELDPLLEAHRKRGDEVTLALLPHLDPERWSRVNLDASGHVSAIRAAGSPAPEEVPLLYPGVMLVSREALNALECRPSGVSTTLWREAINKGRMGGVLLSGHWREIGTPEDYRKAALSMTSGRVFCHASAHIARSAVLENCFIGRECRISNESRIENSVLAEGVSVEEGADISNSVLLGPIRVGVEEIIEGSIRAPGASPRSTSPVS